MKHIELGRIVSGVIDKLGSYKNESIIMFCSVSGVPWISVLRHIFLASFYSVHLNLQVYENQEKWEEGLHKNGGELATRRRK